MAAVREQCPDFVHHARSQGVVTAAEADHDSFGAFA